MKGLVRDWSFTSKVSREIAWLIPEFVFWTIGL
jgi:hypothetical protein